jgi:hypothetical protein
MTDSRLSPEDAAMVANLQTVERLLALEHHDSHCVAVYQARARIESLAARVVEVESAMRDFVVCFHCGERFPAPGTEDHGAVCPKHPMRKLESALSESLAAVGVLTDLLRRLGRHDDECPAVNPKPIHGGGWKVGDCACGLNAALTSTRTLAEQFTERIRAEEREQCAKSRSSSVFRLFRIARVNGTTSMTCTAGAMLV